MTTPPTARRRLALMTAALAAGALALTGCSLRIQEDICRGGEYPALSIGGGGSYCERDGDEPDAGFTRYPEGKVPQQVDDEWDVYWRTHTVDKDGEIVDLPAGA